MLKRSYRKLIVSIAVAFGLVAAAGQAQAQKPDVRCQAAFQGPDEWIIRYDPNSGINTTELFELQLNNSGEVGCTGRLRATSLAGDPYLNAAIGSAKVRYQLTYLDNDITPSPSDPLHRGMIGVPARGFQATPVRFSIDPGTAVAAGRYTRQVTLEYVTANGREVMASKPVTLILEVNSSVLIGLAGRYERNGGIPTINLGELTQSSRDSMVKVYVRSSGPYRMTVTSQNGGELRHDLPGWAVSYGLRMGNETIDLSRPHQISATAMRSHADDYWLYFDIGDVSGRRAGRYTDTLNFTIAAI